VFPTNITAEHIRKAINEINEQGIRPGRHSSTYDVLYEGKHYPPKLIISIANRFANGEELDHHSFHGGKNQPCFELLEKEGFVIIEKPLAYPLEQERFTSAFEKYIHNCQTTQWLTQDESYKFRFANWLFDRIDFDKQSNEDIRIICEESQTQKYRPDSSEKGVNFITQIKRRADHIITLEDIDTIRQIRAGKEVEEESFAKISLSYPKFSIWLACSVPDQFNTYASQDLEEALGYLFNEKELPKKGFKAFQAGQQLLRELQHMLQVQAARLEPIFQPLVKKDRLEPIDWVWITQDFTLYIARKICSNMINYWWVCQGDNYNTEKAAGIIWAHNSAQHHHKRLKDLRKGDRILHYANKFVRAVSTVTEEYSEDYHPDSTGPSTEKGFLVKVDYEEINPIPIEVIHRSLTKDVLPVKYSPLNATSVNQGYLFPFTKEAYSILMDKRQYWVFQANPNQFSITEALKDGNLSRWRVSAHQDKIKIGDKVIIWVTGKKAGCHALATVTSEVALLTEKVIELQYYVGEPDINANKEIPRVDIDLDYVLIDNPITKEEIASIPALNGLKVSLQGTNFSATQEQYEVILQMFKQRVQTPSSQESMFPLNQILYGPPGTGKTYHSINHALQIIEGLTRDELQATYPSREQLKQQFDFYVSEGQIAFCTFHQSFSYEDFIEGIKPVELKEGDQAVKYEVREGIFKKMARQAEAYSDYQIPPLQRLSSSPISESTEFYKMSLGDSQDTDDDAIYQYCLQHNCIALGWGDDNDFTLTQTRADISRLLKENTDLTSYALTAVSTFRVDMQIGDVVVIANGNYKARAIARITGPYEYRAHSDIRYRHFRSVEWLLKDGDIPVKEFFQKNFIQKTIYYLNKASINQDYFQSLLAPQKSSQLPARRQNYVLIIDEINRGNVSQIFGELITLIEDSKRKGKKEALSVKLPYSQKEEGFSVPANLYLIGTMNTADRSVEALDTALRRRFSFIEMPPQPELVSPIALILQLWKTYTAGDWEKEGNKGESLYRLLGPSFAGNRDAQQAVREKISDDWDFQVSLAAFASVKFEGINPELLLKTINKRIEKLIDKDHCIGHSYFLTLAECSDSIHELRSIFANKIIPLLQEYFYGDYGKIELVIGEGFFEKQNSTEAHTTFFAQSTYAARMDLAEREVYRLRKLDAESIQEKVFIDLVKSIYV
jgi:5-methylcytosine-specific restriction endonuclease McrBC GTP-binding regulatory subunit McrB